MQVKKFEARTMKDALEMVKSQMGPDAIILSVRDNNRSFGLVGEGSIEITAAVSEETLHKKKFVESRIPDRDKEKFIKSPAKMQKNIIDKMVQKHLEKTPRPVTQKRYIDIEEPELAQKQEEAQARIRDAAQRAWNSFATQTWEEEFTVAPPTTALPPLKEGAEIQQLKKEIAGLKDLLTQFQTLPQNFSNSNHFPGQRFGLPYEVSFMFEKLIQVGLSEEYTAEILNHVQETMPAPKLRNKGLVEGWVARRILEDTVIDNTMNEKVQVFLGAAGSGKTSHLVKMASHLVMNKGKKVALFTTDTFKVGAADQLRIYAQILNVPFAIIRSSQDWGRVAKFISQVDCILVDTPNFNLKNQEEIQKLRDLLPPKELRTRHHLVVSSTAKDSDTEDLARRYSIVGFEDAIFTALDQSVEHGNIFNFMKRHNCPLHSFGIGPKVPDDFELATKERVLDLLLKITRGQREELTAG